MMSPSPTSHTPSSHSAPVPRNSRVPGRYTGRTHSLHGPLTMHRRQYILKVLELMGCKDEHEHSVRRLPHIDIRHQVESANEIGAGSMQRIENVFLKGTRLR